MKLIKSYDDRPDNLTCEVCKEPIVGFTGIYWFDFGKKAAHVDHLEEELENRDGTSVLLS